MGLELVLAVLYGLEHFGLHQLAYRHLLAPDSATMAATSSGTGTRPSTTTHTKPILQVGSSHYRNGRR
jgi:hypothetical protein